MNTKAATKLCWSCEGRVSQVEENCPFCGVYLSPTPPHLGKGDPIVPLYAVSKGENKEKKAPPPPYPMKERAPEEGEEEEVKPITYSQEIVVPLMALISGSVFLLFGLVLLLFSDQTGYFTLKWSSALWPLYIGLSIILLFLGWHFYSRMSEE